MKIGLLPALFKSKQDKHKGSIYMKFKAEGRTSDSYPVAISCAIFVEYIATMFTPQTCCKMTAWNDTILGIVKKGVLILAFSFSIC